MTFRQLFEFFDTTNEPSLKRMQSVIDGAVCLCSAVYLMVKIVIMKFKGKKCANESYINIICV